MVTGSSVEMAPAPALGGGNFEDFERDLEAMLREAHAGAGRSAAHHDLVRELSPYRSGSAPPTVQGARAAVERLFGPAGGHNEDGLSEEEMRSHPAYLSYYYSNEHLNPRLPPPMVSKEDWRAARRFQAFRGKTESWDEDGTGGSSLFSLQPGRPVCNGNIEFNGSGGVGQLQSAEWSADGLIGLADVEMASRRKSFAGVIQEEFGGSNSIPEHLSQPASRNAYDKVFEPTRLGSSMSHPIASGLNSPARSATPDCQSIGRSLSPCLPSVGGRVLDFDKKIIVGSHVLNGIPSRGTDTADMTAALSGLSLSNNRTVTGEDHVPGQFHQDIVDRHGVSNISTNSVSFNDFSRPTDVDLSKLTSNGQLNFQRQSSSSDLYKKVSSVGSNKTSGSSHYHNAYSVTQGIPVLNNQLDAGPMLTPSGQGLYLNRNGSQVGSGFQVPIGDPLYAQYRNGALDSAAQAATKLNPSLGRNYSGNSNMDFSAYQKAYIEALVARQNLQQDMPFISKPAALNHGFYGSPAFGLGKAHPSNPISNSVLSSLGPGNHLQLNERVSRFPSMARCSVGGSTRAWNLENGVLEEGFGQSLLDEFKNNKTGSYELTDIVDHVVEFSADQFGSRFIQQKLETASVEEKNKIFPEILLHARALMTDVFGNYVIQKFFEHGSEIQRKQLASQLIGHVLPLSLQMYGCRVIQKALEVVDVDYQTQMVLELDGAIMKCVRDQNGNHVIQKCIECVPQEKIQFIISSFYGQVVALSTHPYGCRVIQRVLEHCDDPRTQSTMMDEIMQSVCPLAQDQYGNYVVQHVLQHGKPEERSAIISKLAGKIVEMSQQKFASNVVEKCLTYGMPDERQILINEILGSTDENEPLQAMMKDQFGNYVVQKVLETCDDRNRELILSRVKVYLNALKKYTYGKHIVARVEKLIAAGERRSGSTFQLS